ncbi:sensor histidine kinase [Clostridium sp. BL8]|nr:sensor histidine kinase [Clostridium sp. BL8]
MSRLFIAFYSKKKISRLTLVQFINFLILPIFSMFYITTLMMYVQVYLSPQDIILLIVNIVSILALNIFITNIFENISRNNELKNQLLLHEELSKMQYEYYGAIENKYNSSRKLIHDVKNHINTIENLYKAQEHEKAREYSENMYRLFEELGQKQFTSNKTLNIILNDKYQKAISSNITLKCFVETAELDFIKDIDLTTIFANLLDNAIEAAQESVGEKEICLKVARFNDFLVINVSNTTNEELITKGNLVRTTKKNHSGLGLQNVKLVLMRYQGNMTIKYDEGIFTVNLVIPAS